jgi:nitroimidazol reductase NimA-like FMN-containing flavoprotein (pyridoxamine 5'-phosphate oxidase superfamily)
MTMTPNDHQSAGAVVAEPLPRAIVWLSDAECRLVLARQRMCIVSVVDGDEPYAVPVFYGFDGETLYLGVAEGRKTRVLDANSRVYIVVTEVGPGDAWRSVTVSGRAVTVTQPAERQRGIDVLVAHNARVRQPDPARSAVPRRRSGGRILRVETARLSGRAFG